MRATWLSSFITDTVYLAVGAWSSRLVGSPLQRAIARSRYGALAASYDEDVIPQDGYLAPLEAALDRLPATPADVLDVSTGTGAVVGVLMRRFPGCCGAAVDLSPVMLAHAARHAREHGWPVHLAAADAGCLPFREGTFDLVTVQNAFPVPGELVRVVRPGGWVVMSYSAGGSVLPWIVRSLIGQLHALGCQEVETHRVGSGRCFLARRPGGMVHA
ncbi:MAG: methyltransferase domain-containing protein [Armatimonadetes bacterium]|nr:methyltransferase domain-containing protein [Armatimonadota bacterium]